MGRPGYPAGKRGFFRAIDGNRTGGLSGLERKL